MLSDQIYLLIWLTNGKKKENQRCKQSEAPISEISQKMELFVLAEA